MAKNARVAPEPPLPKTVGDHRFRCPLAAPHLWREWLSDDGPHSQQIEIVSRYDLTQNTFGAVVVRKAEAVGLRCCGDTLKNSRTPQLANEGNRREIRQAGVGGQMELDQLLGPGNRQGPPEGAVKRIEDGGVGPDAQSQRDDCGDRKSGAAPEGANRYRRRFIHSLRVAMGSSLLI